jgi:calcium/proton exchanger cax
MMTTATRIYANPSSLSPSASSHSTVSIALVTLLAIGLVEHIPAIVERGVSDAFVGLILVPLVEKAAEHLTAVDEAWDNQMNLALSHVLGATIQTALFNAPLVVIVGWGLGKTWIWISRFSWLLNLSSLSSSWGISWEIRNQII